MTVSTKADFSGADKLIKNKPASYKVQVGVLGNKDARDDGESNATIGLENEFGSFTKGIPARSFLRMPLSNKSKELISIGKSKMVKAAVAKGKWLTVFELIGIKAEAIIQEAFATRGFGQWAANSPYTIAKKGSDGPLIDTGELRKSISSRVVPK